MTRVKCARTWNGRRRKSREFQPVPMKARGEEEAARSIACSAGERREQPAELRDRRPELSLGVCSCLCAYFYRLGQYLLIYVSRRSLKTKASKKHSKEYSKARARHPSPEY